MSAPSNPLVVRIAFGLPAAVAAMAAVFMLPSEWFAALLVALATAASVEYGGLVRRLVPSAPVRALPFACLGLGVLFLVLDSGGEMRSLAITTGGFVIAVAVALTVGGGSDLREAAPGGALIGFGVLYLALPAVAVTQLHRVDPWLVAVLLATVWSSDTFAYLGGRTYGRHRLAARISPNKTWEGAVTAVALSAATAYGIALLRPGGEDALTLTAWATLAGVSGQFGDLFESALKRAADVKDSSQLLPGHGGLLDRLDALLLAAPVFAVGLTLSGITD